MAAAPKFQASTKFFASTLVPSEKVRSSLRVMVNSVLSSFGVIDSATSFSIVPSFWYDTSPSKRYLRMSCPPVSLFIVGTSGFCGSEPHTRIIASPPEPESPPPHAVSDTAVTTAAMAVAAHLLTLINHSLVLDGPGICPRLGLSAGPGSARPRTRLSSLSLPARTPPPISSDASVTDRARVRTPGGDAPTTHPPLNAASPQRFPPTAVSDDIVRKL